RAAAEAPEDHLRPAHTAPPSSGGCYEEGGRYVEREALARHGGPVHGYGAFARVPCAARRFRPRPSAPPVGPALRRAAPPPRPAASPGPTSAPNPSRRGAARRAPTVPPAAPRRPPRRCRAGDPR